MSRYNNSYRIMNYTGDTCDAITTINADVYDTYKQTSKVPSHLPMRLTFNGNQYVKTINVHNDYELYKFIVGDYKTREEMKKCN